MLQLHILPVDFFTRNPALDVPSNRNLTSKYHAEQQDSNGVTTTTVTVQDGQSQQAACCKTAS